MKYIFSFLILCQTIISNAQDVIYKKDNTKIDAKVLEIGTADIKYKSSSNSDGPVYVLSKESVSTVVFQNGTFEVFPFSEGASKIKRVDSISVHFCRNYIGVDIGEFVGTAIGMTYEHTFGKKGRFALRIPFAVGLKGNAQYYNSYREGKTFSTGVDFLFFPAGQGKFRYYAAPYFEWGMYQYQYPGNIMYSDMYAFPYYSTHYNLHHFAGGVKNGILFQPTRHFAVSADLGFGIQNQETRFFYYQSSIRSQVRANLIVGYRF